jgi:hypothetical protein
VGLGVVEGSRGLPAVDVEPTDRAPAGIVVFSRGPVELSACLDVGRSVLSPDA